MIVRNWLAVSFAVLLTGTALRASGDQSEQAPSLKSDDLNAVISAMTPDEKTQIVVGTGMDFPGLPTEMQGPAVGVSSEGVPGAAGTTHAVPRLDIPSIVLADGPAGVRISPEREGDENTYYATAFPIETALASSWDTDLVKRVGQAMGTEVKEYGVDILLAPALNIHRYPLGGRNFEYYSEDPVVSGKMAAAMVRGVQSQGVGTSLKHYVANNHEWNRNVIDVQVGERALREIYLRGFEIAVKESAPWTIMSSYNRVNGIYASEHPDLLTKILRDQWGFDGLVMTDWFGGSDAVAQLKAGNDLLMPGTQTQIKQITKALDDNQLSESQLNKNVRAVLDVVRRTPTFKGYEYSNAPDLKAHAKLARAAATDGMVLLKNQKGVLPFKEGEALAVFGNSAYDMITGGTGSGDVNEAYSVSLLQGLSDAGYSVDTSLEKKYKRYLKERKAAQPPHKPFMLPPAIPEMTLSEEVAGKAAESADRGVIVIGRRSGEFADRSADGDFYLTEEEQRLIDRVSRAFHEKGKPVVAVLNIGGVIEMVSWRDKVDAILVAWQPGQEAGHAVADVLSGAVNPSGKLATTFGTKLEDYPAEENFPGTVLEPADDDAQAIFGGDKAAEVTYTDDIWIGYRHFNRGNKPVAYPFGYGLSYTEFAYSNLTLSSERFDELLEVSITVKNTGKVAGREVVQLYVSAPRMELEKPDAELRAFGKTRLLQPGQSQTLQFSLSARDLASFDPKQGDWLVEAGKYAVELGASSRDLRGTKTFLVEKAIRMAP